MENYVKKVKNKKQEKTNRKELTKRDGVKQEFHRLSQMSFEKHGEENVRENRRKHRTQ